MSPAFNPPLPISYGVPMDPCNYVVQRCPVARDSASIRILLMRTGAHGDIIMASPILAALRAAFPEGHFTWLVESKESQSIDANPFIDDLILWNAGLVKKPFRQLRFVKWLKMGAAFRREMRSRRYDVFISFQPEEWPTVAWAVGAPKRIGIFDSFRTFHRNRQTSARKRFYTDAFTWPDLPPHRTQQYLLPLRALGLSDAVPTHMHMGFSEGDRAHVATYLAEQGIAPGERYIVLAPMTTWPSRCWPGERYSLLADLLAGQERIVFIGSAKEHAAVERIACAVATRPVVAAGKLSFRQMAALIAGAAALVSGDTGPMHVAAAVETPFVALFGSTPADGRAPLTGEGTVLAREVPCGPCDQIHCPNGSASPDFMKCMNLITVDEVVRAVRAHLRVEVASSR